MAAHRAGRIREQYRAREEWLINGRWKMNKISEQKAILKEYEIIDKLKNAEIEKYMARDKRKSETIAALQQGIEHLKEQMES